jgi:hypothetical protein
MPPRNNVQNAWEVLGAPLYLFAALLAAVPCIDFVQSIGVPQVGNVQWRFATVGLLSSVLLTPMLGLVIAMVTALVRSDVVPLRALALLSALSAAVLFVLLAGFVLDVLQLRGSIPEAGRAGFRTASIKAVVKHMSAVMVLAFLGLRAWRISSWRTPSEARGPIPIVSR